MVIRFLLAWLACCAALWLVLEWKSIVSPALIRFGKHLFSNRKRPIWNREIATLLLLAFSLAAILVITLIGSFVSSDPVPTTPPADVSTVPTSAPSEIPADDAEFWLFDGLNFMFSVLEGDSAEFREYADYHPAAHFLAYVLAVLIPILTAAAALFLLWNHLPHHVPFGADTWYIFSDLEPNSIRMAKSIRDRKGLYIFLRTRAGKQEPDVLRELQDLHYFLYPRDEARFLLWRWRRSRKLRFFFLSENTDTNFERLRNFLHEAGTRKLFLPKGPHCDEDSQQELYLLSETESAPMLIDRLRAELREEEFRSTFANTELRLLDRFRAVSYDLLWSKPLHRFRVDGPEGKKQLHVLVLGFGRIGREFFRAACSLGVIHGCDTKFTICDQLIQEKMDLFLTQCPELSQSVSFCPRSLNADSQALENLIEHQDFQYILVALGDDERNIRVAARLKRFYRRHHWAYEVGKKDPNALPHAPTQEKQPQICVNIEDSIKHEYMKLLWDTQQEDPQNTGNNDNWDRPLHVFGGLDQAFTQDVLMPKNLWRAARWLHRQLNQLPHDAVLNWDEYQRRSSIACAAHAEYHVAAVPGNYDSILENWKANHQDQYKALVDTEHKRWMAYVRSEGMRKAEFPLVREYFPANKHHVDKLGSLTPCLVDNTELLPQLWQDVNELRKAYCENTDNIETQYSFRERDQLLVLNANTIAKGIREGCFTGTVNTSFLAEEAADTVTA